MRQLAHELSREFARQGAQAVVMAGSWSRGDAHRHSDLDLWILGSRDRSSVLYRGGRQVSVAEQTLATARRELHDPRRVGGAVPGWRRAVLLHDPKGIAARLRRTAERFDWGRIESARHRYVAEQIVGWAEEAQKLTRALELGESQTAAVQRNLLADALAPLMAVRRGLLHDTENALWERVGALMGPGWARTQRRALGLERVSFRSSCEAALQLYARCARELRPLLTKEQRGLVERTCRAVGHPLPSGRPSRPRRRSAGALK